MPDDDRRRFESLLRYYQERVLQASSREQVRQALADLVSFLMEEIHKLEKAAGAR